MSHNVQVRSIKIDDLDCLKRAVDELAREGVSISYDGSAKTFRTFRGQPNTCDACVLLPSEIHDIGLVRQKDGTFAAVFDPYGVRNQSLECSLDDRRAAMKDTNVDPSSLAAQSFIGRLYQRYAVVRAEQEGAIQGYTSQRIVDKTNGHMQVVFEVA